VSTDEPDDNITYRVVVNHEEQYSIWPASRENPPGWRDEGMVGSKAVCLQRIKEIWTDMRPLSLRRRMMENAGGSRSATDSPSPPIDGMSRDPCAG
jgi:MbtH protein